MRSQLEDLDELRVGLGQRLREIRRKHDLTLVELSNRTGLSVSFLSDLERARTMPSIVTLMKIADAYGWRIRIDFQEYQVPPP